MLPALKIQISIRQKQICTIGLNVMYISLSSALHELDDVLNDGTKANGVQFNDNI